MADFKRSTRRKSRSKTVRNLHFVDTLKVVLNHLRQAHGDSAHSRSKGKGKKNKESQLTNSDPSQNHLLAIQAEVEDEDITAPEPTTAPKTTGLQKPERFTTSKPEYHLQNEGQDSSFALWCFLQTGHDVRKFLRELWSEVKDGKTTSQVAALVTNEAFAISKRAARELSQDHPQLSSFEAVAAQLDIRVITRENQIESLSYKAHGLSNEGGGGEIADDADLLCTPAYTALMLIREVLRVRYSSADRLMNAVKYAKAAHSFTVDALRSWLHLSSLSNEDLRDRAFGGLDIFTKDVMEIFKHKHLELHLVIAFQACMEIRDNLEDTRTYPCIYLEAVRFKIEQSLTTCEKRAPELQDYPLREADLQNGSRKDEMMHIIMEGIAKPMPVGEPDNILGDNDAHMSRLFGHLPLLAGWLGSVISNLWHEEGLHLSNSDRSVLAIAHLYQACRANGLLDVAWEDMDFLIAQHGRKSLGLRDGLGGLHKLLSAAKQYGVAIGNDLRAYHRYRSTPNSAQRVDFPEWKTIVRKGSSVLRPNTAYRAVVQQAVDSGDKSRTEALYDLARSLLTEPRDDVDPVIREQWLACRKLTPVQLLSVLKCALVADEPSFSFDHSLFAVQCAGLLDSIHHYCDNWIGAFRAKKRVAALLQ